MIQNEYNRYRKTLAAEDIKLATQGKLASKVTDINRLINHQFTKDELNQKLRRQGAFDQKWNILKRADIERDLKFAKANGNIEDAERLEKELDQILNPTLSWGTTLIKKEIDQKPMEAERVHQINIRNQKLNYENVRRAQIEERKAARKSAAAVARGEAAADPFMRVRTVAKTHHDVSGPNQPVPITDVTPSDGPKDTLKPSNGSSAVGTPSGITPKKSKSGFMISHRNNDDENIAALDMDIDIEI
jgi:RNA polymerase-associated protein RTF1